MLYAACYMLHEVNIMKFTYLVRDAKNKTRKGVIKAASLKEAAKLLVGRGWYVKKITPRGCFKVQDGFHPFASGGISLADKALLVEHLAAMLKSGISLDEALEAVHEQASSRRLKSVISKVLEGIKAGRSLSNALAEFPDIFSPLIVNIIKAGEEGGTLEKNLGCLSEELEDRIEFKRHVKSAFFYFLIVLAATFGLSLILADFIFPKITLLFKIPYSEPLLPAKILFLLADAINKNGFLIFTGTAVGLFLAYFSLRHEIVKFFWHQLLIKLPIIGRIIIGYNLIFISRTLGILLKSGLVIDQAIAIIAETADNFVYQKRLKNISPQVQRGKRFSDALAVLKQSEKHPLFPPIAIKMIGIGERSGQFDEPLAYLSEYFQKEVDNAAKNLAAALESIFFFMIILIAGFIAVSVILPIYQAVSELGC